MDAMRIITEHGVIPVLGLKDPDTAPALAAALRRGGLPLLEITMRAPRAMDCLRAIKADCPEMLVGAGTILSVPQAEEAAAAGADFIVSPGCSRAVVQRCQELGVPIVPGCVTPTEIEAGLAMGLNVFKFFPSEALGGMENIRQLCGPYGNIRFIPTAGISFSNMEKYLASDRIAAVGGSFMAPSAMVDACDWDGISALCREAVARSMGFSLAHIGINGADREQGLATAQWFADRFGFPVKEGGKSNFAGTVVEACNGKFPGQAGHIAIGTWSPLRAEAYLRAHGVPLREEFRNVTPQGELKAVYLEEEIAGFAVHIVKRT